MRRRRKSPLRQATSPKVDAASSQENTCIIGMIGLLRKRQRAEKFKKTMGDPASDLRNHIVAAGGPAFIPLMTKGADVPMGLFERRTIA
jgi:hypothetical protein